MYTYMPTLPKPHFFTQLMQFIKLNEPSHDQVHSLGNSRVAMT